MKENERDLIILKNVLFYAVIRLTVKAFKFLKKITILRSRKQRMASRKLKVDAFCANFKDLLSDLEKINPNDTTLQFVKLAFNGLIYTMPEEIVKQTMAYITPYCDKILARDETFFLTEVEKDFKDNDWISKEIHRIREIWLDPETSQQTKEAIWKYMINFVKIGTRIKF